PTATTSALSPARERSIKTMLTSRAQNSGSIRNAMPGPFSEKGFYDERSASHQPMPVRTAASVTGTAYSRDAAQAPRRRERPGDNNPQSRGPRPEPADHQRILQDHGPGHVTQQAASKPDDPRV